MQSSFLEQFKQQKNSIDWELPNLSAATRIGIDTEGTGLKVVTGTDKAIGISIAVPEGQSWYIPFGHERGFNFELDNVKNWAKDNLAGKIGVFAGAKYDIFNLLNVGIDLEKIRLIPHDVQFDAGIVTSKRESFKIHDLGLKYCGVGKKEMNFNIPLNRIYSEDVHDYACHDARLNIMVEEAIDQIIASESLYKVQKIEQQIIYAVAHMERNGAIIDRPKLEQWHKIAEQRLSSLFWKIYRESGIKVEPTKANSVAQLCKKLGITMPITDTGAKSLKNEWLKSQDHPFLRYIYEYRKLFDLKSDYLDKYLYSLDSQNKLRYNLNQLKSDEYGAVTGRFSCSGSRNPDDDKKVNIQQVIEREIKKVDSISDMPIRELFLQEEGCKWWSADASQLQFRIFAHYSDDERLVRAYRDNPKADFHGLVATEILGDRLPRDDAKHENFGNLFGMGIEKGARRLGVTIEEYKEIKRIYNEYFPAAKKLSYKAQELARHPSLGRHPITGTIGRGYVKTLSGRRRRYAPDDNLNSAINAVIQGTEADIVKIKLKELYDNRHDLGVSNLYFTVHDEFDGGVPMENSDRTQRNIKQLLDDHSSFEKIFGCKVKVPIIWDISVGDTWNG